MLHELRLRDRHIQDLEWNKRVNCEKISRLNEKLEKLEQVKPPALDSDQIGCTIIEDLEQQDKIKKRRGIPKDRRSEAAKKKWKANKILKLKIRLEEKGLQLYPEKNSEIETSVKKQLIKPATLKLQKESETTNTRSKLVPLKLRPLIEILHEEALQRHNEERISKDV